MKLAPTGVVGKRPVTTKICTASVRLLCHLVLCLVPFSFLRGLSHNLNLWDNISLGAKLAEPSERNKSMSAAQNISKDDYLNLQCMSKVVVLCNLINSHVHSYAWLFLQKIYLEWNSFTQANMVPSIPNVRECQKRHADPWLSDWLWWPNDASKVQSWKKAGKIRKFTRKIRKVVRKIRKVHLEN